MNVGAVLYRRLDSQQRKISTDQQENNQGCHKMTRRAILYVLTGCSVVWINYEAALIFYPINVITFLNMNVLSFFGSLSYGYKRIPTKAPFFVQTVLKIDCNVIITLLIYYDSLIEKYSIVYRRGTRQWSLHALKDRQAKNSSEHTQLLLHKTLAMVA